MAKAVVIGGGFAGSATALLLAKRGLEVVVLDRDGAAPDATDSAWTDWERPGTSARAERARSWQQPARAGRRGR